MPEMSGYDVIAALRRIEAERAWEPTPVIALTALASPEDRARLLSSGFQLHVTKPIDTGELAAAIATVVGRLTERAHSPRQ
jgi:CheY-like chemotaxis protein